MATAAAHLPDAQIIDAQGVLLALHASLQHDPVDGDRGLERPVHPFERLMSGIESSTGRVPVGRLGQGRDERARGQRRREGRHPGARGAPAGQKSAAADADDERGPRPGRGQGAHTRHETTVSALRQLVGELGDDDGVSADSEPRDQPAGDARPQSGRGGRRRADRHEDARGEGGGPASDGMREQVEHRGAQQRADGDGREQCRHQERGSRRRGCGQRRPDGDAVDQGEPHRPPDGAGGRPDEPKMDAQAPLSRGLGRGRH